MTLRHLGGPGFGLMSPARRSRINRREGDRAGGINIEDLVPKFCVLVFSLLSDG